jgi:hypothetical protein
MNLDSGTEGAAVLVLLTGGFMNYDYYDYWCRNMWGCSVGITDRWVCEAEILLLLV